MAPQVPDNADDSSDDEKLLRVFHEAQWQEHALQVTELVHEDAEMRLLVSGRELVRGRTALAEVLSKGRPAELYSARVTGIEWLGASTALVSGRARFALSAGGFGENDVFWLDVVHEGLLSRADVFFNESEAREEYAKRTRPGSST
jgi:hypothetical protein